MSRFSHSILDVWASISDWMQAQAFPQRFNAFLWFLFVGLILGQLGTIIVVFNGWWAGGDLLPLIEAQAVQGNFVLFSTALLASSAYFLIREYLYKDAVEGRSLKAFILLLAVILMLLGTLTVSNVVTPPSAANASVPAALVGASKSGNGDAHPAPVQEGSTWSMVAVKFPDGKALFHWLVYTFSIILSLIFWLIDDRDAAKQFLSQIEKRARSLSHTAKKRALVSGQVKI